ncbi:hypothetical protein EIP91_011668 [Steccherinum ochraceum]|uniref:DOPA 4,5-dioxygenase n=1 Tax=Steccherinum ochraceum TaxID=92696 RepID=A0A4R0RRD2_9APHY|nr:hypothetical protein EIP91_011668 [Steccherinum ochraceum]
MSPKTDLKEVVDSEIKEWHFHIYFHQRNADEHHAALELRDAVLRLRRDGAFVAVPLFRVNTDPIGPHPVGSYEIWSPSESFAAVFSYLSLNRGNLSILVHPLTREQNWAIRPPHLPSPSKIGGKLGAHVELILKGEKEAAKAPSD